MPNADWVVSASVSGPSVSLTVANTSDRYFPYIIPRNGIGPGAVSWRKNTVASPFSYGRFVVSQVQDVVTMSVAVRVRAASHDWMDYYVSQLVDAFEQFSYTFTYSIDGVSHSYQCEAADWAVGDSGQYDDLMGLSYNQIVTFTVPRHPLPVSGRF